MVPPAINHEDTMGLVSAISFILNNKSLAFVEAVRRSLPGGIRASIKDPRAM